MSPKFSIVVPTMRIGGVDVLFHGLQKQTFRDFELVLVDDLKGWRSSLYKDEGIWAYHSYEFRKSDGCPFDMLHVEPFGNDFPRAHYCRSMNTGLRVARGEIVVLLVDYTWLPPTFLEEHARLHAEHPERVVLAQHRTVFPPAVFDEVDYRPTLEQYTALGMDRYVADLRTPKLDRFRFSIFSDPFEDPTPLPDDRRFGYDTRGDFPEGPIHDHLLFYCRGESVRRAHLEAVDGFDEDYDGSHAYQDSDVADRLKRKLGLEFYNAPGIPPTVIVNPRPFFPHAVREREIASNGELWHRKREAGYPPFPGLLATRRSIEKRSS